MLYDHSGLPYAVAAERCGDHTREKFQQLLDQGNRQLPAALTALQTVPDDAIVKAGALDFVLTDDNQPWLNTKHGQHWRMHDNAFSQLCDKTQFPEAYGNKLRGLDWGRELITENINVILANAVPDKRFLIRSVDGEARGFLSDRYRRLDMRPVCDKLFGIAQEMGLACIQATGTSLKADVKFAYPVILEPIKNEPVLFWGGFRTSDFALAKYELFFGITRAWCTNFATTDSVFSQVHLGKQLPENIEVSYETMVKDTEYVISVSKDVFKEIFSPRTVGLLCEKLKKASETDAPKNIGEAMRKHGLTKAEAEAAEVMYAMPDVTVLPKGDTMWRFSNAISFVAQQAQPHRKLELEGIAGQVLRVKNAPAIEVPLVAVA